MILVSLPKKDNVHQAYNSIEIEEKNEIKNKHKREDKSKKHLFWVAFVVPVLIGK